jgi:hypothetical protein
MRTAKCSNSLSQTMYIKSSGIDCFILVSVVLCNSLVNSENKSLPVK